MRVLFPVVSKRHALPYAASLIAIAALVFSTFVQEDAHAANEVPAVTTVAGSGFLGVSDGAALSAQLVLPTGLAVARNGDVFISDQASQRIRLLRKGALSTVAGGGKFGELGMSVAGGYVDGPASEARFDQPSGLTIGPDGSLFIADSHNGCIRKLKDGLVSTVLGKCGERGERDGDAQTGRLMSPRSLGFDRAGTLWVADYGVGLRKFSDGTVSTVPFKDASAKGCTSLAITPDETQSVVVSAYPFMFEYNIENGVQRVDNIQAGGEGSKLLGRPDQLLALGHRQLIVTDLISNNVRYFRLTSAPLVSVTFQHILAGGNSERGTDNAGFVDGSPDVARFYQPRGIALRGHELLIADAANRRIRSMPLPSFRIPESVKAVFDKEHFEIAYVGPSTTFWDSFNDETSICGTIERRLTESHRIPKPVRCHSMRIDGPTVPAIQQFITEYLEDQPHIDLIVIPINPGNATNYPGSNADTENAVAQFRTSTERIITETTPLGLKHLIMVWQPDNPQISDGEDLAQRETEFPFFPDDVYSQEKYTLSVLNRGLNGSPILQYNLFEPLLRYEKQKNTLPLYGAPDTHTNSRGNAFVGAHIADYILEHALR